jgi:hypothetical protein
MGYIRLGGLACAPVKEGGRQFEVTLFGKEDQAALKAALRATPGADEGRHCNRADVLAYEADNPCNAIALWATGFEWEHHALLAAMEILVPAALPEIAHLGARRRIPDLREQERQNWLESLRHATG